MTTLLQHRGYFGSIEFSPEDEVFFGKLEFIRDLVTFEASDARKLKTAFEDAVDDYLDLCAEQGRKPDEPLKGSFIVRPGRELHRRAMLLARRKGSNLNTVVTEALKSYIESEEKGRAA